MNIKYGKKITIVTRCAHIYVYVRFYETTM